MKAKVYAENMEGERRYLGSVIYDNAARAIDMYRDDCEDFEHIILIDDMEE